MEEDFGTGFFSKTQKHLWNLFENPHHSCAAKVYQPRGRCPWDCRISSGYCSRILPLCGCLNIVPYILYPSKISKERQKWSDTQVYNNNNNNKLNHFSLDEEYFFEVAEAVFVGWFTFEYVIRFIAAPRKME